MRVAVVGHVEWVEFLRVPRVPAAGEIVHATDVFEHAAGGGGVASVQLRKLAGACTFFTALGDDEIGRRAAEDLRALGVDLEVAWRDDSQRRAVTFVDDAGERTITVLGAREVPLASDPLPWDSLSEFDAVYLTGGDAGAVRAARAAKVLVATSRVLPLLVESSVELDAVVGSAADPSERYRPGDLDPAPRYAVMTAGARGGTIQQRGKGDEAFAAASLPGPVGDAYGAGDSFAAGLTYGLGAAMDIHEAVALAARCGAHCMTGHGPYAGQLELG
ncbi:MAG TPA: PfkB family carbohydrate kinase [Thermoleophilaceae bacterium]